MLIDLKLIDKKNFMMNQNISNNKIKILLIESNKKKTFKKVKIIMILSNFNILIIY